MKILLLADINSSHTRKWVRGLRAKGIEVAVFSMSVPREDWYTPLNVTCKSFGADAQLQSKQSALAKLGYLKAISSLRIFYKSQKVDIVHAHYATSYGLLGALLKAKPYLISVWGSDIQDFPYRSKLHKGIMKFIFSRANMICSTSQSMLKDIDYVGAYQKVQVPFGINIAEFDIKHHENKDVLNFGTIKTLETVYGIDLLLQAFQLYLQRTQRKDKLIVYGKGAQSAEYHELAKDLGVADQVIFKGYVERAKVSKAFQELDVYLSLSRRESYGVAALEASASALPVITSKAEGFSEVVEEGRSGYRVDIKDLNGVVERMISLQDLSLRSKLGNYGREMVEKNFVFEKDVQKQIEVYSEVLKYGKIRT